MRALQLINSLKISLLFVLSVLICGTTSAQTFLKSYDYPPFTTRTEVGRSIENKRPVSKGWTIAGFSNSTPNAGGYDWLYQRTSFIGTVECATLLGFPMDDSCFSHSYIPPTKNDVLAGFYRAPDMKEKASISILDSSCMHLVSKQILDSLRHQWRQVIVDPTGIVVAGFIETYHSPTTKFNKVLVAKYTFTGGLMWAYRYVLPAPSIEEGYSVCYQPFDGTYAITGRTNVIGGIFNVFILKVTGMGIPIWFKIYSFPATPAAVSNSRRIIAMPDGGFVVAGWTSATDPASRDIYIFRVTSTGAIMWSNTYGLPGLGEEAHSIISNSVEGTLIFTGFRTAPGAVTEDIILAKISAGTGAIGWMRTYPNASGHDRGYDLESYTASLSETGYAVSGQIFPSVSSSLDPFLMKTDLLGKVTSGCVDSIYYQPRQQQTREDSLQINCIPLQDIQIQPQVSHPTLVVRNICVLTGIQNNQSEIPNEYELKQNYPNPFNPSTNIQFAIPESGVVTLKVYDNAGKEVQTLINEFKTNGSYIVSFSASGLSSGVYYYKLTSGSFSEVKKMLLIK